MNIVKNANEADEQSPEFVGFCYMMVQLCNCANCTWNSFRAIKGCTTCAINTVNRLKESDAELVSQYKSSVTEIKANFSKNII